MKPQKSFSKIYNVGDETSNDGLIWFWDVLEDFTKPDFTNPKCDMRNVTKKFKITITEITQRR